MGQFSHDAYIIVMAHPHPLCPCESRTLAWNGVHQRIRLIAPQTGGMTVFQNTLDPIPDASSLPDPPGLIPYDWMERELQQLFNQGGNQ